MESLPRRIINIPCAECSSLFAPSITRTKICIQCLSLKNDITIKIQKSYIIDWCRYCFRYSGSKWSLCNRESKELLSILLKKINGIKHLRLLNANFIWTEEHSRRIKVNLVLEKDLTDEVIIRKNCVVEFEENSTQCDKCKKNFTPHIWTARVQIRQKIKNKKTFFFLEQMLLKNNIHKVAIKIKNVRNGMDFLFAKKNEAQKLIDFLNSAVPSKKKQSKELVSHDTKSQTYNYKYTFLFEIPKICKEDLILLPKKLTKEFGGVNTLGICFKITNKIHLYDPVSMKKYEMNSNQYFNFENTITIIPFKGNETEFYITDIYFENKKFNLNTSMSNINSRFAYFEANRIDDHKDFSGTTHLGHILNHGDSVKGYDLTSLICNEEFGLVKNQKYLPDVILIRKIYPGYKKRIWKLKRMRNVAERNSKVKKKVAEKEAKEEKEAFEDFIEEIEQDQDLRRKINLFKNDKVIKESRHKELLEDDQEMVKINELLEDGKKIDNEVKGVNKIKKNDDFIQKEENFKLNSEEINENNREQNLKENDDGKIDENENIKNNLLEKNLKDFEKKNKDINSEKKTLKKEIQKNSDDKYNQVNKNL